MSAQAQAIIARDEAAQKLASLSHTQLGEIFVQSGGLKGQKTRKKSWLIDRILWYQFDFAIGHEIIRGPS